MTHGEKARIFMDKRQSPRLEVYLPVEYHVAKTITPKKKTAGLSRDIGTGGIGLLLKRKLASGTVLSMNIHVPGGKGLLRLQGEVIRCHANKNSPERGYSWRAGLKFLRIQTKAAGVLGQIIALYNIHEKPRKKKSR